jgi:glutamate dehydrogenase
MWQKIEVLNNKIPTLTQTEMLYQYRRTVRRATRWFLRHYNKEKTIQQSIEMYSATFKEMSKNLNKFMAEEDIQQVNANAEKLLKKGVPKEITTRIAQLSTIFSAMDIAEICEQEDRKVIHVASLYYKLGSKLELHWFLGQITKQPVSNHWQALARASFREELDWQQRSLTSVILRCDNSNKIECIDEMIDSWIEANKSALERWSQILAEFKAGHTHEFAKFSVALRELMLLSLTCQRALDIAK